MRTGPGSDCACMEISQCQFLKDEYLSVKDFEGLKQLETCGFNGAIPMYCCNDSSDLGFGIRNEETLFDLRTDNSAIRK